MSVNDLQKAADAASLAGTGMLDNTLDGWKKAKRAALGTLRQNIIFNGSSHVQLSGDFKLNGGIIDNIPGGDIEPYQGSQGTVENVTISIERGNYGLVINPLTEQAEYTFVSLEGSPLGAVSIDPDDPLVPMVDGVPVFSTANAVKISLKINNYSATFGRIFQNNLGSPERNSIAAIQSEVEECVIPIGIPECALLFDTTPGSNSFIQASGYSPRQACERELVVTDASPNIAQRQDGMLRSSSYPRPAYYYPTEGGFPSVALSPEDPRFAGLSEANRPLLNYRALPFQGVFGTSGNETGSASPGQVANIFKKPGGCIRATVGQNFQPLDDALVDGNFFNNTEIEIAIADLINNAKDPNNSLEPLYFKKVFGDPRDILKDPATANPPQPNFPFLRTQRPVLADPDAELRFTWPDEPKDGCVIENGNFECLTRPFDSMLMSPMDAESWTNPMCHSSKVPAADDLDNARARPVKLMVITSQNGYNYCDHQNVIQHSEQTSNAPTSKTQPKIVGFVDACLLWIGNLIIPIMMAC